MAVLTDKQLSAQLRNWHKKKITGPVYGIRTDQEFRGSAVLDIGGHSYDVAECRSDLEARELIGERPGRGLVMLFRVGHERLGEDLLSRLAKERLLSVDTRESLMELFQAKEVDPRILSNPKLVEALVTAAAAQGGVVTPIGVLDIDLAWSVLLAEPDWTHRRPDLVTLLCWSLDEERWAKIHRLELEVRKAFFGWVEERAGDAARFIDAAESSGHAETLVPIGLALGLLFDETCGGENERMEGRVRIENYLGKQPIGSGPALAWHLAAVNVVKDLPPMERSEIGKRLDHLLKAVKIEGLAIYSDFSVAGLRKRVQSLATALQRYGKRKSEQADAELTGCFQALRRHTLSEVAEQKGRLERAEMGIRLALWLKRQDAAPPPPPTSLETAMAEYLLEGAFVDRARFALFGGDASDHELSQSYHSLAKQAAKIRQEQQHHFGTLLEAWCAHGGQGNVLAVESIIADTLAPLAVERPVLLLVLDGMSGPVFHELLEDFLRREWQPIAREAHPFVRPAVAALPSVTSISRAALFSGKIDVADKRGEAVAFRDQPSLTGALGKSKPCLFLKGDLTVPGQSFLSEEVRDCLASPSQRIAAVLLNVIDDQLSAGDQLEVRWRIQHIRFLEGILEAAAQADRLIVLTSDHGHIPDLNQTAKSAESAGGGDRYRNAAGLPAGASELFLTGARVQAATGQAAIIAACEETVRYGNKKAGYHGGASDLEVVIPLAVLEAGGTTPDGWQAANPTAPAWWQWKECLGNVPVATKAATRRSIRPRVGKPVPATDELPLFAGTVPVAAESLSPAPAWMQAVVDSAVYKQQLQLMGKLAPQDKHVLAFLAALDKHKDLLLLSALASETGIPLFRLRGLLSSLSRLFNVDGYPVLEEDRAAETVRLDRKLLAKQFDLLGL